MSKHSQHTTREEQQKSKSERESCSKEKIDAHRDFSCERNS